MERVNVLFPQRNPNALTIEDHLLTGGLFTIASEVLTKYETMCSGHPVALENRWFKPELVNNVLVCDLVEQFSGKRLTKRILQTVTEFE